MVSVNTGKNSALAELSTVRGSVVQSQKEAKDAVAEVKRLRTELNKTLEVNERLETENRLLRDSRIMVPASTARPAPQPASEDDSDEDEEEDEGLRVDSFLEAIANDVKVRVTKTEVAKLRKGEIEDIVVALNEEYVFSQKCGLGIPKIFQKPKIFRKSDFYQNTMACSMHELMIQYF